MILITGLGNFPEKYKKTRHNFGFLAVEHLAQKFGFSEFKVEKKFFGDIATGQINNEKVILLKPNTLMNLSGKAVLAVKNFYKIPINKVWVFSDDLDLEFEQTRFREKGSSGGQRGIADIINLLGVSNFPRIKFGITNDKKDIMPTENFVLSKFSEEEWKKIPQICEEGVRKFLAHFKAS